MGKLTDKTVIPLGLAVAVIGGAAWWLATQAGIVLAHGKEIEKIKASREVNQVQFSRVLNRLDRRVFEIQIKLGIKPTQIEGDD